MEMLNLDTYQIVAVVSALFSIAALILAYFNGKSLLKQKQQADAEYQALLAEFKAISKGSIGVGQKLMEVESKISGVVKKTTELENTSQEHPGYDHASRLIDMGASVDDLVKKCGFPRAEAELLVSLKRTPQRSLAS